MAAVVTSMRRKEGGRVLRFGGFKTEIGRLLSDPYPPEGSAELAHVAQHSVVTRSHTFAIPS